MRKLSFDSDARVLRALAEAAGCLIEWTVERRPCGNWVVDFGGGRGTDESLDRAARDALSSEREAATRRAAGHRAAATNAQRAADAAWNALTILDAGDGNAALDDLGERIARLNEQTTGVPVEPQTDTGALPPSTMLRVVK